MLPSLVLFAILSNVQASSVCPFTNATVCASPHCKIPSAFSCRTFVDTYCDSDFSSDPGCLTFHKPSFCPFNNTKGIQLCRSNECRDPSSSLCKSTVSEYCSRSNTNDIGCTLFSLQIPPIKEKKRSCPFNASKLSNPCNAAPCVITTAPSCRTYVDDYCTVNSDDTGCVVFHTPRPQSNKGSVNATNAATTSRHSCPFNQTSPSNPCTARQCAQPTSSTCLSYVNDYCNTTLHDSGCVLFAT